MSEERPEYKHAFSEAAQENANHKVAHPWIPKVLWAAAAYNILWGAWIILRPTDLFSLTGIPAPTYLGIWQCVGMIVGVYGVGYAIAATDHHRHWPIVLVGLLGKVLGPIGFVFQWLTGSPNDPGFLPLSWGLTILTNDLIWWIPFAAILYIVAKASMAPQPLATQPEHRLRPSEANRKYFTESGTSIADLSQQSPLVLLFLRHSGCTFCREALADLKQNYDKIVADGTQVAIVHQGDPEQAKRDLQRYGLPDVQRIHDPSCQLYRAYDLNRGKVGELFGPDVWWRGFKAAILSRHGVGKLDGDGFQMPGAFLVHKNRIVEAYRHQTAADRPDLCELALRGAP